MKTTRKLTEAIDLLLIERLVNEDKTHRHEVAVMLFPQNKHPENALHRMLKGKTDVSAGQLQSLSFYYGVPVEKFYGFGGWKISDFAKDSYVFEHEGYRAVLNLDGGKTTVTFNGTNIQEIVLHKPSITLREYVGQLNDLVDKHKNSKIYENEI